MSAKSPTLSKITPVLLCGGSGTRLWPLSRKSYPKQFTALTQEETLFQATAQRFQGDDFAAPMVLTQSDFRFIVTEQLAAVGVDPGAVVIEPSSRNTGPAILAAALHLHNQDPEALMLVAPSDHVITDEVAFQAAVAAGAKAARAGSMVTFGIEPTRPETGFGYLHLSHVPKADDLTPVPLTSFVEKPNLERAQEMADAGDYLWNAGIFLFSTASIIAAFKAHAPNLMDPVQAAFDNGQPDLGFLRLAPDAWDQAEDISIDFAVMERSDNLMVVPFRAGWSDLGDWDAIWRESASDATGVVTAGHTTAIDCTDTLLRAEMDNQELVGIGLDNIIAVAMPDAVLVADRSRSQDVKNAVVALRQKQAIQADAFLKDHRPWGWFETLALGDRFQVKRIVVKPGGILSLQSHVHRAEHWIVVSGTAKVTVGDDVKLLSENQSVYIPLGAIHRMENPGKLPMTLIEVQTGAYLGEDDIVRYEDLYSRGQGAKG